MVELGERCTPIVPIHTGQEPQDVFWYLDFLLQKLDFDQWKYLVNWNTLYLRGIEEYFIAFAHCHEYIQYFWAIFQSDMAVVWIVASHFESC